MSVQIVLDGVVGAVTKEMKARLILIPQLIVEGMSMRNYTRTMQFFFVMTGFFICVGQPHTDCFLSPGLR